MLEYRRKINLIKLRKLSKHSRFDGFHVVFLMGYTHE